MSKKLLLLLTLGFLSFGVAKAQYVTLQDTAFRNKMIAKYPICFNAAGQMDTTCNVIRQEVSLSISDSRWELRNLDGIKYFKGLKFLEVQYAHNMTSLAQLPDSLEEVWLTDDIALASISNVPKNILKLYISESKLTTLPASIQFTRLKDLGCNNGLLTSLPPLPATIQWLNVGKNKLTSLPRLDTLLALTFLGCNDNKLTAVPALRTDTSGIVPMYDVLAFGNNLLTSFPVFNGVGTLNISYNQFITWPAFRAYSINALHCGDNPINYLPAIVSNGCPTYLSCQNLNLYSLPPLPPHLKTLDCARNPIANLPGLPGTLEMLNCNKTSITTLSGLPATLLELMCDSNNVATLPALPVSLRKLSIIGTTINCLPKLPASLQYLYINSRLVRCIPNSGSNLLVLDSNRYVAHLPFCNPTNNANACYAFPVIRGRVFYDLNSNGSLEANEHVKARYKVALSNGAFAITDDSGFYQLSPDTLNNINLIVNPPDLYNAVPANKVFNFTTSDTTIVQNIALQPIVIKDSIAVYVTPYTRARPGFDLSYGIRYENVGTTNLSNAALTFHFDTTLIRYNGSSGAAVTHTGNTLSLISSSPLAVGSINGIAANFTLKNNAPLGSLLSADGSVVSGSSFSSDTSNLIIVGSFDPNDKTATTKLTPAQLAAGAYVDYVVRFQNTGTDTAFHVVLADTLSNKLQANTLEVIATSHLCKTTLKDKVLTFEFRDIMLPDSNVNEPASNGYVRFRVKPVTGLVVGDAINNKAAIYFDYNSPIITNIAVTQITSLTFPLNLLSFIARKNDKTNLLKWATTQEINVDRFEIERSHNGREFSKIGTVKAGSINYTFADNTRLATTNYYRLKMIGKGGSFSFGPVRLISNNCSFSVVIFPNPAKDKLQIQITSDKPTALQMQVVSLDGKRLISNSFTANEANTLRSINISSLQKGSYLLKVVSFNKEDSVLKFEKL